MTARAGVHRAHGVWERLLSQRIKPGTPLRPMSGVSYDLQTDGVMMKG